MQVGHFSCRTLNHHVQSETTLSTYFRTRDPLSWKPPCAHLRLKISRLFLSVLLYLISSFISIEPWGVYYSLDGPFLTAARVCATRACTKVTSMYEVWEWTLETSELIGAEFRFPWKCSEDGASQNSVISHIKIISWWLLRATLKKKNGRHDTARFSFEIDIVLKVANTRRLKVYFRDFKSYSIVFWLFLITGNILEHHWLLVKTYNFIKNIWRSL